VIITNDLDQSLNKYSSNTHYDTCLELCKCWFDLLSNIQDVEELKTLLQEHTFVGTVLLNESSNQAIKYDQNMLIFNAIVKHTSHRVCLLPEQSSEIFERYSLPMAPTSSLGTCKDYDELCDTLYVNYCDVSVSTIELKNEGYNIILVKRKDEVVGDRVLSISKTESIQFQLIKEMQESLRSFFVKFNEKE